MGKKSRKPRPKPKGDRGGPRPMQPGDIAINSVKEARREIYKRETAKRELAEREASEPLPEGWTKRTYAERTARECDGGRKQDKYYYHHAGRQAASAPASACVVWRHPGLTLPAPWPPAAPAPAVAAPSPSVADTPAAHQQEQEQDPSAAPLDLQANVRAYVDQLEGRPIKEGFRVAPTDKQRAIYKALNVLDDPDKCVIASEWLASLDPEPLFPIVLKNTCGVIITLMVKDRSTVHDVKEMLERKLRSECIEFIPNRIHLLFKQRPPLEDDRTLASYNIQTDSTLLVVMGDGNELDCSMVVEYLQARRIAVAAAVAESTAKALPPGENPWENFAFSKCVAALNSAIVTDKHDREHFSEYLQSQLSHQNPEKLVKSMERWPRLRRYWPRLRRRICSNCCKHRTLSQPRLLVCGACGEGRYCSEGCQQEHWAARHQEDCGIILHEKLKRLKALEWRIVGEKAIGPATMMIQLDQN